MSFQQAFLLEPERMLMGLRKAWVWVVQVLEGRAATIEVEASDANLSLPQELRELADSLVAGSGRAGDEFTAGFNMMCQRQAAELRRRAWHY